jgi:hypothetical protein
MTRRRAVLRTDIYLDVRIAFHNLLDSCKGKRGVLDVRTLILSDSNLFCPKGGLKSLQQVFRIVVRPRSHAKRRKIVICLC